MLFYCAHGCTNSFFSLFSPSEEEFWSGKREQTAVHGMGSCKLGHTLCDLAVLVYFPVYSLQGAG